MLEVGHNKSYLTYFKAKWRSFMRLARFNVPIPIVLLLSPCIFVISALHTKYSTAECLILLSKVIIGAVLIRPLGCTINDIIDINIDRNAVRTKNRPLANGELSVQEALAFFAVLAGISLALLLSMNVQTILVGIILFVMIIIYPFTKRFLPIPQLFLGIVFAGGSLICGMELTNGLGATIWLIYMGCVSWIMAYDTIYAFQDIEDDRKMKLNSSAIFFKKPALAVRNCYDGSILFWLAGGIMCYLNKYFFLLSGIAWILLRMQAKDFAALADRDDVCSTEYKRLFDSNAIIGLVMTIAFLIGGY